MNILFIGDIVGKVGRHTVKAILPALISKYAIDVVIANGENAASGNGITKQSADELYNSGIDIISLGNHAWANKDIMSFIETEPRMVRPLNFPPDTPGKGYTFLNHNGKEIAVINLLGRIFLNNNVDCPFRSIDKLLEHIGNKTNIIIIDFHAEATAEKMAMGWYVDGRVSAVCGTHTHIQTADEKILQHGTGYITDVGMTGPSESVLGIDKDIAIKKLTAVTPVKFKLAKGASHLNAVVLNIDEYTGNAKKIDRLHINVSESR